MPQTETVVGHEDVVVAVLGVSAGLSGLVLVFLGLLLTSLGSFGGAAPGAVLRPYRWMISATLVAFGVGIMCVAAAATWLVGLNDNHALYVATVVLFALQIATLLVTTIWTTARLAWAV